jgi:hypothetical protein
MLFNEYVTRKANWQIDKGNPDAKAHIMIDRKFFCTNKKPAFNIGWTSATISWHYQSPKGYGYHGACKRCLKKAYKMTTHLQKERTA